MYRPATILLMNPQQYPGQQPPQPVQNPTDPYAFIMQNGAPQPKSKFTLPTGGSPVKRALIFGGGFLGIIVVSLMLLSLLSGGGGQRDKLIALAQEQTEIIRVAELARNERAVRSTTTQSLASTTSLSVSSSRVQTIALISGKKPNEKTLALKKSTKTDTLLASAASNNEYDKVFTDTITSKLKAYQTNLKKLFNESKSTKEKTVLQNAYNGTQILLGASSN